MGKAPERIWAVPDMDDVPRKHWDCGVWRDIREDAIEVHGEPVIEYVRADRIEQLEAQLEKVTAERDKAIFNLNEAWYEARLLLARAETLQKESI